MCWHCCSFRKPRKSLSVHSARSQAYHSVLEESITSSSGSSISAHTPNSIPSQPAAPVPPQREQRPLVNVVGVPSVPPTDDEVNIAHKEANKEGDPNSENVIGGKPLEVENDSDRKLETETNKTAIENAESKSPIEVNASERPANQNVDPEIQKEGSIYSLTESSKLKSAEESGSPAERYSFVTEGELATVSREDFSEHPNQEVSTMAHSKLKSNEIAEAIYPGWMNLVESLAEDALAWKQEDALLKSHVLLSLLIQDTERMSVMLQDVTCTADVPSLETVDKYGIVDRSASIIQKDEEDGLGSAILPHQIQSEMHIWCDFSQSSLETLYGKSDVIQWKERLLNLKTRLFQTKEFKHITERWNMFGDLLNRFGILSKLSFDVVFKELMRPGTQKLLQTMWNIIDKDKEDQNGIRVCASGNLSECEPVVDKDKVLSLGSFRIRNDSLTAASQPKKRRSLRRSFSRVRHPLRYMRRTQKISTSSIPWTHETRDDILIAYRLDKDGLVSVKMRAKLRIPTMSLLVCLDDLDRLTQWVPYCISAKKLAQYSNSMYILSLVSDFPWPIRKRETIAYCGCVEALDELGQLTVFVQTPSEENHLTDPNSPIPPANPKLPRIPSSFIAFFISPMKSDVTAIELQAKMDVGINTRLLRGIIPWVVKNSIVDFFAKVVKSAAKVDLRKLKERSPTKGEYYEYMNNKLNDFVNNLEDQAPTTDYPIPNGSPLDFDDFDTRWVNRIGSFKVV